ncbi:MAG: SMI1/KNR4 family protein [Sporomusaceae bacterium]|nr:SMI1/KNR4 family protein [Sporomusaceae bacterium]
MNDLLQVIRNLRGILYLKGASDEDITAAEHALRLEFAAEYKQYVKAFGCIAFGNHEFTGLNTSERLSVVAVTRFERKNNSSIFPANMYVVETLNDGDNIVLQNLDGEIYMIDRAVGECKKISGSLSDYISSIK